MARPRGRWQQLAEKPLAPYDAMEAVAALSASPQSLTSYAASKGLDRLMLSNAVLEQAPDLHARLIEEFGGNATANKKRGTSFESAVRGMLMRRGYYVLRTYASKTAVDMLAVGLDKPNLMVQAKRDGRIYFTEWNKLYEKATEHGCWPVMIQRPPGEDRGFQAFRLLAAKEKKGQPNAGMLAPFDPKFPAQDSLLAPALAASGG